MAVTRSTVVLYSVVLSLIVAVCVGLGVWFLKPNDNSNYTTTESSVTTTTKDPYAPSDWPVDASAGLIVRTDTAIRVYDGTWTNFRRGYYSAVDYYKNETLYYCTTTYYSPVRSTSKRFPDLKYPGDDWVVNTLAVDDLTKNLYVYDENFGKIDVFDLQGKYMGIVLSDLYMVKDIALDLWHGYLFILQTTKILKAGMDGEGLEVIVSSKGMDAFTADPSNGLLYYSQGQEILVYKYFNTGSTYRVALIEGAESIISLSILQNKLFYATRNSTKVVYTIQSCALGSPSPNGKCVNTTTISNPRDNYNPVQLKSFDWWSRGDPDNSCKYENGGCEQLCVRADNINTDKRNTCQCKVGWQLNLDAKTCSPVSEYLMYVRGYNLRGNLLDLKKESFVDATVPLRLDMNSLQYKKLIDFDSNAHKGYFIFTDDFNMWRVNLLWTQQQGRQKTLDTTTQYKMYPAVDWVADQVYYLRTQFKGGNEAYLMVRRPDVFSPFESQGIVHKFKETEKPGALVVDPSLGCLFFTVYDTSSKKAEIYRINSDGSGLKTFEVNDVSFSVSETSLGYDYSSKRLYWFTKDKTQIQHANFEGGDLVTFNVAQVSEPRSINVHREWIYVNNEFNLWRFLKETGESAEKILSKPGQEDLQRISAAKGYGASLQPISENHPCAINKGGCEVYCFGVPDDKAGKTSLKLKKVCGCSQNQKLQDDKKSCKYDPNWQE